jgi:hypothetical protein
MKKTVEIVRVNEDTATFDINGRLYDAFYYGDNFRSGEKANVILTQLGYPLALDTIFGENKRRETKIEKSSQGNWTYHCYGAIKSIKPIIADFGDFQMDLGNWTNDEKVIGEHIYWTIDRLDIQRAE